MTVGRDLTALFANCLILMDPDSPESSEVHSAKGIRDHVPGVFTSFELLQGQFCCFIAGHNIEHCHVTLLSSYVPHNPLVYIITMVTQLMQTYGTWSRIPLVECKLPKATLEVADSPTGEDINCSDI